MKASHVFSFPPYSFSNPTAFNNEKPNCHNKESPKWFCWKASSHVIPICKASSYVTASYYMVACNRMCSFNNTNIKRFTWYQYKYHDIKLIPTLQCITGYRSILAVTDTTSCVKFLSSRTWDCSNWTICFNFIIVTTAGS